MRPIRHSGVALRRTKASGLIVGLIALATATLGVAPAGATPIPGGNTTPIAAPPSVLEHALVDPTAIFFFFESETLLPAPQAVDDTAAGSFDDYNTFVPGTISKGTCIDSWFLQFDPGGLPPPETAQSDGSVTFDTKILGVEAIDPSLDATDYLGASGTTYPTGIPGSERGMEVLNTPTGYMNRSGNPDSFAIDAALTTLSVHMDTGAHFDQFRVFTACNPTVTTVGVRKNNPAGVPVRIRTTVTALNHLPPTPSGTVDFYVDGVLVGSRALNAKGKAFILVSALSSGTHTAQVFYLGNPPDDSASSSKVKKFHVV
jgi:hypothetical protein